MGSDWFRAGPFCLVARILLSFFPVLHLCVSSSLSLVFLGCFFCSPVCCGCDRQPILIQLMEEKKTDDAIIVFIFTVAKIHLLYKLTNTTDFGHIRSHLLHDLFSSSVFLCCRYPDDVFFFILGVVATTYYSLVVKLYFCSLLLFSEVLVMLVIGQEKEEDARPSGKAPSYFLLAESVLRWTKRHSTTSKQK
jgi:hypothetical protein